MKKYLIGLTLLILSLAACAPQAQPTEQPLPPNDSSYPNQDSYPNEVPPSDLPANRTLAERAALSALSGKTGLPADKIKLVSTEAVTWQDGCLGVQRAGMMCTQAIVEGFRIVLEADGKEYEFHTNQDGSLVVLAAGDQVLGSVEGIVAAQLAENLGLDKSDISVVSSASVEFADACLGVAMQDVACAQGITPGLIVVLEAGGVQYEYHTSADGARVQPATLALTWRREGGIAGFCDSMTVFLSGEVYVNRCNGQPEGKMGTFANLLSASERKQFDTWISEFGQVDLDASDPKGVSDRMVRTLAFFGAGNRKPAVADEDALFLWAQDLFQKLNG